MQNTHARENLGEQGDNHVTTGTTRDHPFIAEDSRTTHDSIVDLRSQDRQASCTPERSSPSERTQNSAHLLSNLGWLELANGARLWGLGAQDAPQGTGSGVPVSRLSESPTQVQAHL